MVHNAYEKLIKNAFHFMLSFFEGKHFNEAGKNGIKSRTQENKIQLPYVGFQILTL